MKSRPEPSNGKPEKKENDLKMTHFEKLDVDILTQQNNNLRQALKRLQKRLIEKSLIVNEDQVNDVKSSQESITKINYSLDGIISVFQNVLQSVLVTVLEIGVQKKEIDLEISDMSDQKNKISMLIQNLSLIRSDESWELKIRKLMNGVIGMINWVERDSFSNRKRKDFMQS